MTYPTRCVQEHPELFHAAVLEVRKGICTDPKQNSARGLDLVHVPSLGLVEVGTDEPYRTRVVPQEQGDAACA